MDSLIELARCLYHIDFFRRSLRALDHNCTLNCTVCAFKTLFSDLNSLMRETVLDPVNIHRLIEANLERVAMPTSCYTTVAKQLEQFSGLKLRCEFNVTKICLNCRTTSFAEQVSQYQLTVDASTLLTNDWPSFEFALKTALDSEEFCIVPNCFGQTKIFRLLTSLPPTLPINFTFPSPTLTQLLPSKLRPHLIFEIKSITDLTLKAVILKSNQWGHATIFLHTRLNIWIFIDSRRVLSLHPTWCESRFHPILHTFVVQTAFYSREELPPLPNRVPLATHTAIKKTEQIYENWPPPESDIDSGQGSEFSSVCESEVVVVKKSEKYATVRRKMRRSGSGASGGNAWISNSVSVPDLRGVGRVDRKVSFNCEVTLVDDLGEEYMPHPIFQRVLERLRL